MTEDELRKLSGERGAGKLFEEEEDEEWLTSWDDFVVQLKLRNFLLQLGVRCYVLQPAAKN